MLWISKIGSLLGVVALTSAVSIAPGNAVELKGERTAFNGYPLITSTSQTSVGLKERYQFTIDLPENAGESLRTVTFRPVIGSSDVDFMPESVRAKVGDETVAVTATAVERDGTQLMEVTFDESVAPGSMITIQVKGDGSHAGPGMVALFASADGPNPIAYMMGCLPTAAAE